MPQSISTESSRKTGRLIALCAIVGVMLLYGEFTRHALKYAYNPEDQTKGDFLAFYEAAKAMVDRGDLYAERHRNYIYPPLVAFLYMPLTVLHDPATQHRAAGIVALLLNVVMSIVTVWMLASEACRRMVVGAGKAATWIVPLVMLLAVVIVGDKVRSELRMWQTNVLMLFFLALGLRWLDKRPVLAGICMGLAVNVKYLPIFFLPYLLVRRRFRAAAGMVGGILIGAFAPALYVGWSKNLEYLRVGFSGLLALVGVHTEGQKAVTEDIAGGLSVSLTSAFARALGGAEHGPAALAISAVIAAAICVVIALMYRRATLPLIAWPSPPSQSSEGSPFSTLVMLEWSVLILALLVFSPQTNPRHLYLLLLPAAAAATIIVAPATPRLRILVIIGSLLLVGSLVLPPGGGRMEAAVGWWRAVSGPSWGMLAMMGVLVWAGIETARVRSWPASPGTSLPSPQS